MSAYDPKVGRNSLVEKHCLRVCLCKSSQKTIKVKRNSYETKLYLKHAYLCEGNDSLCNIPERPYIPIFPFQSNQVPFHNLDPSLSLSPDQTGANFCFISRNALQACRDTQEADPGIFGLQNRGRFLSYEACTTPPIQQCQAANFGGPNNFGDGDEAVVIGGQQGFQGQGGRFQPRPNGFQGQQGGFQGPQFGGFQGSQFGGFQGPQQGGFQGQFGGFQGQQGGFQGRPNGFQGQQGGFQGQFGGFQGPQQGGFQGRPNGFQGQQGGFQGQQQGFQGQFGGFQGPQQGGFQGPQPGGFQGPQFGGFQGNQGGFQGNQFGGLQGNQFGGVQRNPNGGFQGNQFGGQPAQNGLTFNLANLLGIRAAAPEQGSSAAPSTAALLGTRSALPAEEAAPAPAAAAPAPAPEATP